MICAKCENAGHATSMGLPTVANMMHNMCQYPASCTCQHAVGGEWINGERTRGLPHPER